MCRHDAAIALALNSLDFSFVMLRLEIKRRHLLGESLFINLLFPAPDQGLTFWQWYVPNARGTCTKTPQLGIPRQVKKQLVDVLSRGFMVTRGHLSKPVSQFEVKIPDCFQIPSSGPVLEGK
jgi:hypothetical protein